MGKGIVKVGNMLSGDIRRDQWRKLRELQKDLGSRQVAGTIHALDLKSLMSENPQDWKAGDPPELHVSIRGTKNPVVVTIDSREASLSWLREELAKLGVQSYIIPANDTQGPSLHCGWGEAMVTVNICYGNYLFLDSLRQWVKIPGNRPQDCAEKIIRKEETHVLGQ